MRATNKQTMSVLAAAALVLGVGTAATAGGPTAAGAAVGSGAGSGHGQRCALPGPYELPHGGQPVDLHARDFTTRIDNTYWPMTPGTRWRYLSTTARGGRQLVRVQVTDRTRPAGGIQARVVRDVAREDGELVEKTFDFYAQDSGGSVWYLGENTKEYEHGHVVSTEGSWRYGVDGAQAGVLLPASPAPGCTYRQEFHRGDAEDRGAVLSLREDVRVGGVGFHDVLTTSDTTSLEPYAVEHKFYAPGVGPVLSLQVSPGTERERLLSVSPDLIGPRRG